MVRSASEGGHSAGMRRLRLRRRRHQDPHLRRNGRIRKIFKRALRTAGLLAALEVTRELPSIILLQKWAR